MKKQHLPKNGDAAFIVGKNVTKIGIVKNEYTIYTNKFN